MTDFEQLVQEMRETQKEYFRTRDANVLNKARDLESKVDKALKDIEEKEMGGSLFDAADN